MVFDIFIIAVEFELELSVPLQNDWICSGLENETAVRNEPITRVTIQTKNSKIPNQTGQQILFLHGLHLHKVPSIPMRTAKLEKAIRIANIIFLNF